MLRALVASTALFVLGCQVPFVPDRSVHLTVNRIIAPTEHPGAEPLMVTLVVETGGCRTFERIAAQRSPSSLVLTAHGRTNEDALRVCTMDIRLEPRTYRAAPPFANPFTIIARQPDGSQLTHQVRIR